MRVLQAFVPVFLAVGVASGSPTAASTAGITPTQHSQGNTGPRQTEEAAAASATNSPQTEPREAIAISSDQDSSGQQTLPFDIESAAASATDQAASILSDVSPTDATQGSGGDNLSLGENPHPSATHVSLTGGSSTFRPDPNLLHRSSSTFRCGSIPFRNRPRFWSDSDCHGNCFQRK